MLEGLDWVIRALVTSMVLAVIELFRPSGLILASTGAKTANCLGFGVGAGMYVLCTSPNRSVVLTIWTEFVSSPENVSLFIR